MKREQGCGDSCVEGFKSMPGRLLWMTTAHSPDAAGHCCANAVLPAAGNSDISFQSCTRDIQTGGRKLIGDPCLSHCQLERLHFQLNARDMVPHSQDSSGRAFGAIKQELSSSLLAIKKPTDFITTLIYCIPILAPIRVCLETNVFRQLADHAPKPLTATELCKHLEDSNANDGEAKIDFIIRMMRAVCVLGLADEDTGFTYKANELTTTLADAGFSAGFQLLFDNAMGPRSTMTEMVSSHATNDWLASSTALDGPWQRSRGTAGKSTFDS